MHIQRTSTKTSSILLHNTGNTQACLHGGGKRVIQFQNAGGTWTTTASGRALPGSASVSTSRSGPCRRPRVSGSTGWRR